MMTVAGKRAEHETRKTQTNITIALSSRNAILILMISGTIAEKGKQIRLLGCPLPPPIDHFVSDDIGNEGLLSTSHLEGISPRLLFGSRVPQRLFQECG